MTSKSKFEDLDLTSDEIKNLTEALKKEEFRKLFVEYAEEISDPENRRKYEEEITQLENERGMDVEFLHPNPGFVIKTCLSDNVKVFVNICTNDKIEKPSSSRQPGMPGLNWSIPHSFAPPKEDLDKKKAKCQVVDFLIHPDTLRMVESNARFRQMIYDIAFDGMDKQFDLKVDRKNVSHPSMKFKGIPNATVIRNRVPTDKSAKPKVDPDDIMAKIPLPNEGLTSAELAKQKEAEVRKVKEERERKAMKEKRADKTEDPEYTEPKYSIKHRNDMDMAQFTNDPYAKLNNRPSALVVEIDLPLIKSASDVDLDIFEKKLCLTSIKRAKYKLELKLPYPVDENAGNAKFEKGKKRLIVTLPVLPAINGDLPNVEANGLIAELSTASRSDEGKDLGSDGENPTSNLDGSPLIEMLPDETKQEQESEEIEETPLVAPKAEIKYIMPSNFDYNQDDESINFIIHLKNISRDDMAFSFDTNGCEGKMMSVGSGGFPMHYSFVLCFPEGCTLETGNCYSSLSPNNIAVTLIKTDQAIGMWDSFKVGIDKHHLEERLFLTEANLEQQLEALDQEEQVGREMPAKDACHTLEVTEMNEEKLTLQISPCGDDGSASSPCSPTDSSDSCIEVVHEKEQPKLHGILKQRSRTLSDSSDDAFSSSLNSGSSSGGTSRQSSAESPITEEESDDDDDDDGSDEDGKGTRRRRNKSVSFSEHVDKTTFKTNASVSSMTPALKSKRRRQRKIDQKRQEKQEKQERRRRRSSGSFSEYSSADEQEKGNSNDTAATTTAAATTAEEEVVEKQEKNVDAESSERTSSESSDIKVENGERTSGKKNKKRKNRKGKNKASVIMPKVESDGGSGDGPAEKQGGGGGGGGEQRTNKDSKQEDKEAQNTDDNKENDEKKVKLKKDEKADDGLKSMLNWSDGPVIPPPDDQSAVVLSNSVMFDLDMD